MSKEKLTNKNHLISAGAGSIKGIISGLPYIGPAVIGAWDGYCASRQNEFINELSEQLNNLDNKKVDQDYIDSEEFYDFFHRALRTRCLHRSKIKARFILGLVLNSVTNDRDREVSTSLKEQFLSILDQLSDEEMKLLYDFSEGKYTSTTKEQFYKKAKGVEIDGLIAKSILTVNAAWDQCIILTAFGEKFISYMRILAKKGILVITDQKG